jgi:hypothetical protein
MDLKRAWTIRFFGLAVVAMCMGALPSFADPINLLTNGGFEDPVVPPGSMCGPYGPCLGFHNGVVGNNNIGGWELIGKGGVDPFGNPIPGAPATILLLGYDYTEPNFGTGGTLHFHPQEGRQSVDLTGEGNQGETNGIKQGVGTTSGQEYVLTFWVGHQYPFAPGYLGPGSVALYVDGQLAGTFTNPGITFNDVNWAPFSFQFTAATSQTAIAFVNATPVGNNYAGLDNVSLVAVPEPASLLVVAAGVVWLASRRRS